LIPNERERKKMTNSNSFISQHPAKAIPEDDRAIISLVQKADELLAKPQFTHEDRSRAQTILERADIIAKHFHRSVPSSLLRAAEIQSGLDPERHEAIFHDYLLHGITGMNVENRTIMQQSYKAGAWAQAIVSRPTQYRAQAIATGAAGGFLAPQSFMNQVEESLKHFSAMRRVATVVPTASGSDMPWPTVDDIANVGELLVENAVVTEQDVAFGQIVFTSYKYSSKLIRVSVELLTDAAPNIEQVLASLFSRRIGRLQNQHFTTGTGTGQPLGVLTTASLGKTGTTGQTATVIYDDLVDFTPLS
jgi:HK97 family phage major capsid protein